MKFYIDVKEKLEAAGFSFHTGEPFDPELSGKPWACWTGPAGGWDVECTETRDHAEFAVLDALDKLIDFAVDSERLGGITE